MSSIERMEADLKSKIEANLKKEKEREFMVEVLDAAYRAALKVSDLINNQGFKGITRHEFDVLRNTVNSSKFRHKYKKYVGWFPHKVPAPHA